MKICIVGPSANYLRHESTGGAEKQIALLARYLARREHHVVFVETGHNYAEAVIDDVEVVGAWESHRGIRGIRWITYRLPLLMRVLSSIYADVYYTRGVSLFTSAVIAAGKNVNAVTVLGLANDRDLFPDSRQVLFASRNRIASHLLGSLAYRYCYYRGLPMVDWVIAQNIAQGESCEALGIPYEIIPSFVDLQAVGISSEPIEDSDVIWVGNIGAQTRRSKGFENLVAITQHLANVRFEIAGFLNKSYLSPGWKILERSKNVRLLGQLSPSETIKAISRNKIVINTSPSEGFSNVFLEAWLLAKPVVTLHVNPNNLLHDKGFGYCADGDITCMTKTILYYLNNDIVRREAGCRGRVYAETTHSPDRVCQRYEALFKDSK